VLAFAPVTAHAPGSVCGTPPDHHEEDAVPLMEKIDSYSVWIGHSDLFDWGRVIRLKLESGGSAYIGFPPTQPPDWLEIGPQGTTLYLPAEEFDDVYHLLQTEAPAFFTAFKSGLLGIDVGVVHTELDLSMGEPPGEGEADAQAMTLETLIRRAQSEAALADGAA
jgi:hypothetical protein